MIDRRQAFGFFFVAIGVLGLPALNLIQPRTYDINQALSVAEGYLSSQNNPDLAIWEIMEFEQNYYVIYYERSTGIGAFEMLIDKGTGRIFPEYGPNMMWNTKYGRHNMMGGWRSSYPGEMTVSLGEAVAVAQQYLDSSYPGAVADDPHRFYGYYTIHAVRDGQIFGMLSVNSYNGEVWYHDWHGGYIQSLEIHGGH